MKYKVGQRVIGLKGKCLGCRGIVKATLEDKVYGIYFSGIGNYNYHESSLIGVDEFKAIRAENERLRTKLGAIQTIAGDWNTRIANGEDVDNTAALMGNICDILFAESEA